VGSIDVKERFRSLSPSYRSSFSYSPAARCWAQRGLLAMRVMWFWCCGMSLLSSSRVRGVDWRAPRRCVSQSHCWAFVCRQRLWWRFALELICKKEGGLLRDRLFKDW